MKFLSITISKKLFFIFLINSVIMVTISGMVIFSFSGLSSQFDFNSDLSAYKTNLDAIRIEQSKLKGHAQSFYLNVSDQTVKEGLQNMSSSISFISESLGKLKNDENQEINDSTLESISFLGNIGYDTHLYKLPFKPIFLIYYAYQKALNKKRTG